MDRRSFLIGLSGLLFGCGGGGDMRPARDRYIDGVLVNTEAYPLRRTLTTPDSETGLLKSYVTSTAPLTITETSIARAYVALFGRAPDRAGLAYWSGEFGAGISLATAIDNLITAVASARVLDTDNRAFVGMVYNNLFNKTPEEDDAGTNYWTNVLNSGVSKGTMVEQIFTAVLGVTGYHADTCRNRLLVLESICRLQKAHSFDLSMQDSRTSVIRTVGAMVSYEEAMGDIYRLIVSRVPSSPISWAVNLTSSELYSRTRVPDGTTIRQHRYLVWYNRSGEMMLAQAYLPPNFTTTSLHRGIISLHGGGWRQGYPERLYGYNIAFAAGTDPSYVVLAPTYHLTAFGSTSPTPENDVSDFLSLVKTSSFLKVDPNKVGIFGESAGGHLAVLTGSKQDVVRVFAMYPPIDLRGNPAVSADLDAYVDYYVTTTGAQEAASANVQWSSARTTQFQLWHGTGDSFVPSAQSQAFKLAAGSKCKLVLKSDEGHGFSTPVKAEVISAAITFFDERQPL